jgi:inner membrane transporter RhtA
VTTPTRTLSPVWLVLIGIVSVQVGAAIAKLLFDEVQPTSMVWLRLCASSLMLFAIARPQLTGRSHSDWVVALGFGATLCIMNVSIYESFARIPLGLAVTIEFLGPLAVAVVGSHRPRDLLWVGFAGVGVALLGIEPGAVNVAGIAFALLAGAAWAAYILLSVRTGARWPGLDGLAVASAVATLLLTPYVASTAGTSLLDAQILGLGVAVGILSSVIPYSFELIALRTLRPATFGILMSLEPAAAALAGVVLLGEWLTPWQLAAVGCVIVASVGATSGGHGIREPVPD